MAQLREQLAFPRGRTGAAVAALLNVANRGLNRHAVRILAPRPGERVLDVGVGGGVGTALLLERGASVVAIDPSPDVVAATDRRFGHRTEVHEGTAAEPGVEAGSLDGALSVNTVYFWPDVGAGLAGLHAALRPGGRMVIGVERGTLRQRAGERPGLPGSAAELEAAVTAAGFVDVHTHAVGARKDVIEGFRPGTGPSTV